MNIVNLRAALNAALDAIEENPPVRVEDSPTQAPIGDFVDQTSVQLEGEDVCTPDENRRRNYQLLDNKMSHLQSGWFTEPKDVRAALNIMMPHTNGTVAKAQSLAQLMVAMCHWHGQHPSEFAYKNAVEELDNLSRDHSWWSPLSGLDYMLFEEPAQALFWRTCDYVTPHAALNEGAIYGTDSKVTDPESARIVAMAVSETWGTDNGSQIGMAFTK